MLNPFDEAINFFKHILEKKNLIFELTIRDFSSKYAKSYLGNVWAVLDSLLFILVLWLVFGYGLGGGQPIEGVSFIVYLSVGFIAYHFFQATIMASTSCYNAYAFLLQRVDFRPSILPVVMVLSNILKHLCAMLGVVIILLLNGVWPSLYWLQMLYYLFALSVLMTGVVWLTASINPFFPDIQNVIAVILRFFMFGSPIFWSAEQFSERAQKILAINPLYYIILGYRESLIYHKPFWDHPYLALYFWTLTLIFILIGIAVYTRLKPHFMDVV